MRRATAGLTLPEVLVAAAVTALAMVGGSWALSHAALAREQGDDLGITALLVAREIHELALELPGSSGDPVATQGSEVTGLDTLDGASFSPPINASKGQMTLTDRGRWTQQVSLAVRDLSDPEALSPYSALAAGSGSVVELTVTVLYGTDVEGTYRWWLAP